MQLPSAETSLCAKNKIKKGKKRGAGVGAWWDAQLCPQPLPSPGGLHSGNRPCWGQPPAAVGLRLAKQQTQSTGCFLQAENHLKEFPS